MFEGLRFSISEKPDGVCCYFYLKEDGADSFWFLFVEDCCWPPAAVFFAEGSENPLAYASCIKADVDDEALLLLYCTDDCL